MADFRLSKPKKAAAQKEPQAPLMPKEAESLLSRAGGAAASGLHTIGSGLSASSRGLYGTINGLAGLEGGYGNRSLLDSTGGIELSGLLGNLGVIAKNDPSKWELLPTVTNGTINPGDLGRGVIDMLGDPTSWLGIGGLTRAGVAASRTGTLARGLTNSVRQGHRGLISFRPPLASTSHGAIGTGAAVADALEGSGHRTGVTQAIQFARHSAPVAKAKELFHASSMGRTTHATQEAAERAYADTTGRLREADLATINAARNMQLRPTGPLAADAERHLIESGRPSAEVRGVMDLMNARHREAQDLGIPVGDLANTVKPFRKVGAPRAMQTIELDHHGNPARVIDNTIGDPTLRGADVAPVNYLVPNTAVQYAPRDIAEGIEWGGHGADGSRRALGTQSGLDQHRNTELFGNASTDLINQVFQRAGEYLATLPPGLSANQQARAIGKFIKREFRGHDLNAGTNLTGTYTNGTTAGGAPIVFSRPRELGNFIQANPQLTQTGPFTNHVVSDIHTHLASMADKNPKAAQAVRFMAEHAAETHGEPLDVLRRHGMDNPPTIRDAAGQLGLNEARVVHHTLNQLPQPILANLNNRAAAEALRLAVHHVSQSGGDIHQVAGTLLDGIRNRMVGDLHLPAAEYKSLTGLLDSAPVQKDGFFKSLNTVWKANMLAHPATQARNAVSAGVTNILQGAASPTSMHHAVDLIRGRDLSGYAHIPAVANEMAAHGISETEALRRLAAVHIPAGHSIAGDLPAGQIGTQLDDIAGQVPGTTPIPASDAIMGPLRALAGYRDGSHVGLNAVNPTAIRGAFGHTETGFGPAMASNMVAQNVEQPMRIGGWLGLLQQGYSPEEASRLIGQWQVNYGSREFSEFEKQLKNVIPFYAFSSRAGRNVAGELALNPGGRMAQVIEAQDRSSGVDPSIPDSVGSGTAIPLGESPDGTAKYLTGLGLAHEPAVHTLGALAGGDFRGAGYDLLGMLNPLLKTPLEATTKQSFYTRGESLNNMESNIGRTLANLGVFVGLRDKDAGPVSYPGGSVIDPLLQASPFSRLATTARSMTDTRKTVGEKLLNNLTGAKISDVSPEKRAFTLRRRAQELAQAHGAKSRADVYFSKAELEQLEKTNPALAQRQRDLQKLLNSLKAKKQKATTPKVANKREIRFSKVE